MRELRIDFENGSMAPRGSSIPLLIASLVLIVLVTGAYRDTSAQVEYWSDEVARLGNKSAQPPASPRIPDKGTEAELKRANEIVKQLALPWDQLFLAIEAATPSNVALLGIEPNAQKQRVRLTGEGRDIHAVLAYVQELEAQPVLRDVYLLDHGTPDADPERPARFVIEAIWRTGS
jgi:hypothetical protein